MTGPKKLFVKSYGCQMNVYDSRRMADTLAPEGYVETATPDDADLVILNTCHIREKAAEKVYSELGRLRVLKQEAALAGPRRQDRGGGLRRAGRGQGDLPPRARGRSRGRTAELSPAAARCSAAPRTARSSTPSFRPKTNSIGSRRRARPQRASAASRRSSPCRKAATSSARSASCPIRADRKCPARSKRSSPKPNGWPTPACARSRCSARTSTPIMATTPPAALRRSHDCCTGLRTFRALSGCATPRAIRATWTTA